MDTNSNERGMRKSAGAATDTPAGLSRTTILLRKLRAAAEVTMGRTLTYDELSDYTGEPRSTLGRWFNGDGGPSPEIILRLLELIPEKARHDLMDKPPFCRVYPRIDHPSISHDPVATSILNTIALKSTGLTLVQGDTDSTATFVATAIGHSSRIVGGSCTRQIMGLDVHKPDWFVPIPEVHYLRNLPHPKEVEKELEVLCRLAAHHFTDVGKAMREMTRGAKTGGYVAVIDMEGDENPELDSLNHDIEVLHDPTHVRSYTVKRWRELWAANRLEVIACEGRCWEIAGGLTVRRWCELGNSGQAAFQAIRDRLKATPAEWLAQLEITQDPDGEFRIPVRTLLILGRKGFTDGK